MRKKRRLLLILLVAIVAVAVGGRLWMANPLRGRKAEDLRSVAVRPISIESEATLELPEEEWGALLGNLSTGRFTWKPLKWQGLAVVTFTFENGREIWVTVFDTGEETGAFQIGGKYYRGGEEEVTRKLVDEMR